MTDWGLLFGTWLLHTAVGGGILLLLVLAIVNRYRQPARRQRIGEWGLAAAMVLAILSVGPSWLVVPLLPAQNARQASAGLPHDSPRADELATIAPQEPGDDLAPTQRDQEPRPVEQNVRELVLADDSPQTGTLPPRLGDTLDPALRESRATGPAVDERHEEQKVQSPEVPDDPAAAASRSLSSGGLLGWLTGAYLIAGSFFLARWLMGYLGLRRLLRESRPAPESVLALFQEMAGGLRQSPRLLVSNRLGVPMSFGLCRPTVAVPASLCEPRSREILRWVFAHELTHVARRDAWACFLFGVEQVVYFYVPWFWSLRRHIRLCQEYIADAAAAEQSGNAEDYAQFLLGLIAAPAVPLGTTGVTGNSSDLFRRITMLLNSPQGVERRCPRGWSLVAAGGLFALAVLVSGISLQANAASSDDETRVAVAPVPEQGKTNSLPKKDEPAKKDKDKLPAEGDPGFVPGIEGAKMNEQLMKMREEMLKNMQQMQLNQRGMMPGMMGPFGNSSGQRLGVMIQTPGETLADQLDLPRGRGVVITHVQADSAAGKAGIKAHDILLEFNGKPVANDVSKLIHILQDLKANTPIDAVVLRKSKEVTIKGIVLPEAKAEPKGFGGIGMPGMPGAIPAPAAPLVPRLGGEVAPPAFHPPGLGAPGAINNQTVITTNFRTNNRFTTRHQEGSLIITVTGTVDDGKSKVTHIQVQDGSASSKYESVDKVPEQYRDKVKNLIEANEKSNVRIELRTQPEEKRPAPAKPASPQKNPKDA